MSCRTPERKSEQTARDMTCRQPAEDRFNLFLLSFLLTADRAKAEQCFVAGLDLGAEDNSAVREWAHSWARQIVVHNATRLIAPRPDPCIQQLSSRGAIACFHRLGQLLYEEVTALF